MRLVCPVGHPSGAGRHCPLCGRAYVPAEQAQLDPYVAVPRPRHALDEHISVPLVEVEERGERVELEALAMLSSLASDFDY